MAMKMRELIWESMKGLERAQQALLRPKLMKDAKK
jgi:hypothetical protein